MASPAVGQPAGQTAGLAGQGKEPSGAWADPPIAQQDELWSRVRRARPGQWRWSVREAWRASPCKLPTDVPQKHPNVESHGPDSLNLTHHHPYHPNYSWLVDQTHWTWCFLFLYSPPSRICMCFVLHTPTWTPPPAGPEHRIDFLTPRHEKAFLTLRYYTFLYSSLYI